MGLAANFVPTHLTMTANKGETIHLSMELHSTQKRDVTWKYNGIRYLTASNPVPQKMSVVSSVMEDIEQIMTWGCPVNVFFYVCVSCRKLLLHDSLERYEQSHCCTDCGECRYCQSRHLQCQLCGGQPTPGGLDEAHCQRFVEIWLFGPNHIKAFTTVV